MDQPRSLTLSLHHSLLKPEKCTHSSTARLPGTAQTFREVMKRHTETVSQPLQGLCAPLPAGRCLRLGSVLKSRDAPFQGHLGCIPHQASREQKPNPGSLCGESPNSGTPGSCLSKSERRPGGREPEVTGTPQSLGSVSGQCWGCLKGLGVNRDVCKQLSGV